jgi:hypothetical protein
MAMISRPYPVSYDIERPDHYNRWTVLFRIFLAIPQLILVGGSGGSVLNWVLNARGGSRYTYLGGAGFLGAVLGLLVFFAWFYIMFTGTFPGYRNFAQLLFRWQQNVQAYMALQAAPYPPFGEGPYPLRLEILPPERYNRVTVFFRLFLAIPHYIILFFLAIAQFVVTVIAWFAILFTGQYPEGMFNFSVGVSRWNARVSAYMNLFVDEYPPFSLVTVPTETPLAPPPAPPAMDGGKGPAGLPALD